MTPPRGVSTSIDPIAIAPLGVANDRFLFGSVCFGTAQFLVLRKLVHKLLPIYTKLYKNDFNSPFWGVVFGEGSKSIVFQGMILCVFFTLVSAHPYI